MIQLIMNLFLNKKRVLKTDKRTVLLVGGSGVLGKAFFEKRPENTFVINVSRKGELIGNDVLNRHGDVLQTSEKFIEKLAQEIASIDVVIPLAYDRHYSSIEKINKNTFLQEIELDVFLPMHISILCGKYFWSKFDKNENISKSRKVIAISSGASFGKTSRPELATYSGAKAALNVMTEYLHNYLFSTYGVSAHVVAPGSLHNEDIKLRTVTALWKLESQPLSNFSLQKIF